MSRDGAPFANGTEYDAWFANWCAECTHEPTCPILIEAFTDTSRTPDAWVDDRRDSLGDQFRCLDFSFKREAEA